MSIKIKQQKILSADELKKRQRVKKAKAHTMHAKATPLKDTNSPVQKKPISLIRLVTFAIIAGIILISPKPSLITYEKSGLVAQSIYWPDFYFIEERILDSHINVSIDNEEENIFFCHTNTDISGCQKYRIIEKRGMLAVFIHVIND